MLAGLEPCDEATQAVVLLRRKLPLREDFPLFTLRVSRGTGESTAGTFMLCLLDSNSAKLRAERSATNCFAILPCYSLRSEQGVGVFGYSRNLCAVLAGLEPCDEATQAVVLLRRKLPLQEDLPLFTLRVSRVTRASPAGGKQNENGVRLDSVFVLRLQDKITTLPNSTFSNLN